MWPARLTCFRIVGEAVGFALLLSVSPPGFAQGAPATPVRFTEAREHAVRESIALTGSVESRRSSVVASEVEGIVAQLVARDGDKVGKGAPLVRLRSTTVRLRLEAIRGQLQEAQARQTLARTSLERSRGLFEERIISQQQLDDAASEFEAWEGRVAQLGAEVARLEDDLERTTVRAPFAGVVVREMVAEGEWLAAGGAVAELLDFNDLEVTIAVPEGSFSGLQTRTPVRVTIAALEELEVEGVIRAVVPKADSQARTFPVKIAIDSDSGRVAAGMLARVHLPVGATEQRIIVPKDAIVEQGNQKVIYRIAADETVERLAVQTGSSVGVWLAVDGDLAAGDRIVTRGNERLFPGQAVRGEQLEYGLP